MVARRWKRLIGLAMVAVGLIQALLFVRDASWIPTALGLLYAVTGIAYLYAEI